MKKILTLVAVACITITATAQTFNIQTGNVKTTVAAADAGEMTYSDGGQTLTVCGKAFSVSDIDKM